METRKHKHNKTQLLKNDQSSNSFHFIALIIGTLALSLAPIFVRYCDTSASSIAFWRMMISTPLLALGWLLLPAPALSISASASASAFAFAKGISTSKPTPTTKDYFYLVLAGVTFGLDLLSWNAALTLTTVANATLLVNFASLFVALISWLLFGQTLGRGLVLGMMVAIVGGAFLVWPNFQYNPDSFVGDGLGLLAALFYGIYLLSVQRVRPVFNTLTIMTITGAITAITALIMAYVLDQTLVVSTPTGWAAIIGLAIVVQMIGQSFIAFALVAVSATLSAIVLLLQPVISALLAVWLFSETLVWIQTIGMGLILFGIGCAKFNASKKALPIEGVSVS